MMAAWDLVSVVCVGHVESCPFDVNSISPARRAIALLGGRTAQASSSSSSSS